MARIIPGVQVSVVKEVVPPQLAPSGVLGIVGFTENFPENPQVSGRASSWAHFIETFGASTAHSIPEARQALENGVYQLVVAPISEQAGAHATVKVKGGNNSSTNAFTLTAKVPGAWANVYSIEITKKDPKAAQFDLVIYGGDKREIERHRRLDKESVEETINKNSTVVNVSDVSAAASLVKLDIYSLSSGKDATPTQFSDALNALQNEPDVDMVIASISDFSDKSAVTKIYSKVISHCERMSTDSKGRIGFGQALPQGSVADQTEMVEALFSDRFVMTAPHGVAGAVAGRVGSLSYFKSPTFKTLSGLGVLKQAIGVDDQRTYLKNNIVPIVTQRGQGTIVVRGLTTDGDQISVRRVADRSVRGMKMLGDLFIGRLNNEDGRNALKQKLIEFLVQMEKEGAIVPKTDGSDPAFKVDVYSSQADFAQGIVRVDMAVRPVRAIDFIYATILVQV
ncbi:phage tail sheath C-terminal domain-containing protein [Pseudomonadota bacterium]